MPQITFRDVDLSFRGPSVLEKASFSLDSGERVCLIGRNGTGKTSLLRLIQGGLEPQEGEIARQQGLVTAILPQEVPNDLSGSVFDQVAVGLGSKAQLLTEYHHAAHEYSLIGSDEHRRRLDRVQHQLDLEGGWLWNQQVEAVLSRMGLDGDKEITTLSAGLKRRVLLARALVGKPDILLLDEPTNHLDTEAIQWLEEFLLRYEGTILFVTHDRVLIRRIATRILELDRGHLTSWACDYETYLQRKEAALETETRQQAEFDKKLAQEEVWIRTGIRARRTRNEGRVRALQQLREVRRARRERIGDVRMETQEAERSGRLVIEAKGLTFQYDRRTIIRGFSTLIMRGDRVGIVGANGSGKTTLLRLLLGELAPQDGRVRHGTNLEIAYFDQLHAQLDEAKSVRDNVANGADFVDINGRRRHIIGFLSDFLFSSEQAAGSVSRLSGGERNRLLLARMLAKPSNLLVLDEPTNDLDIETLELLEQLLVDYAGTLLLVSHDREFINNVVSSTLVLDGTGNVKEYAGGYDDWLRQRAAESADEVVEQVPAKRKPVAPGNERPRRLTYAEQRELETLPEQIAALEADLGQVHQEMAAPDFYKRPPEELVKANARLRSLEKEIADAYQRWELLESMA